jgi:hypothetical protein
MIRSYQWLEVDCNQYTKYDDLFCFKQRHYILISIRDHACIFGCQINQYSLPSSSSIPHICLCSRLCSKKASSRLQNMVREQPSPHYMERCSLALRILFATACLAQRWSLFSSKSCQKYLLPLHSVPGNRLRVTCTYRIRHKHSPVGRFPSDPERYIAVPGAKHLSDIPVVSHVIQINKQSLRHERRRYEWDSKRT